MITYINHLVEISPRVAVAAHDPRIATVSVMNIPDVVIIGVLALALREVGTLFRNPASSPLIPGRLRGRHSLEQFAPDLVAAKLWADDLLALSLDTGHDDGQQCHDALEADHVGSSVQ